MAWFGLRLAALGEPRLCEGLCKGSLLSWQIRPEQRKKIMHAVIENCFLGNVLSPLFCLRHCIGLASTEPAYVNVRTHRSLDSADSRLLCVLLSYVFVRGLCQSKPNTMVWAKERRQDITQETGLNHIRHKVLKLLQTNLAR